MLKGKMLFRKFIYNLSLSLAIFLCISVSARAELIDNHDGTITQIRSDGSMLMWLQDANYLKTIGYNSDGALHWDQAMAWIDTFEFQGFSDWRLPSTLPVNGSSFNYSWTYDGTSDRGHNITSLNSELAYMFYMELASEGLRDINGSYQDTVFNAGPFINLDSYAFYQYWTGAESTEDPAQAFYFHMKNGYQETKSKASTWAFVWAVRDISSTVVPEPISATLFIVGGAALGLRRFRKKFRK